MLNLTEYQNKSCRISDLLPWAALVAEGVVLNKDGSFQQTLRFRGPDLESSTQEQLVAAIARLNNALKRLGSGWALFVEARRQHSLEYPQEGDFPDPVSWLIDAQRRDEFERQGEHYESQYFLTFQYLPPREALNRAGRFFVSKASSGHDSNYDKTLSYFKTTLRRLYDILKDFMFEVHYLDDDDTLTYLHTCVSDKHHTVTKPPVPMYLDGVLADTPLTGGLEPILGKLHLRTITIMSFPANSVPAILDQLNHLPIQYRWVSRYLPLDKLDAEKILKNYRRQWFAKRKGILTLLTESFSKSESAMVDTAAVRKSQDADAALQELVEDHVSFGYYTGTVTVWDENPQVVAQKAREVERIINGLGFTTILETMNALDAWLSSLPGHCYANVRMPLLHSLNLSHLIPFSATWAGPQRNEHLDAPVLTYAKTSGNTPFRLSTHVGDVGHQMIIGPTGAGKSVLMCLIAMQFMRYSQAQVFIFDKGGSFYIPTVMSHGHYYEVGAHDTNGLVFQPLAHIDQETERIWAAEWVAELMINEHIDITPEVKEAIWKALLSLSAVPKAQRTITGLKALVQDKRIRRALDTYTLGGPFGDILDAGHELFYEKSWQCFEMEALMSIPTVIPVVLSYLFHVLDKRFSGRPTLLILDEAWLFLDHPIFAAKIREWLKTLRKKNVSVIFATQSVNDALNASIASALIESCPSRIFLPNDRALEPQVQQAYLDLGLNPRQIHILANAIPKRQYYYESHVGNSLFELGLSELSLAICAASRSEDKKAMQEICSQYPDYLDRVDAYLRANDLAWAADIIKERSAHE